MKKKWMGVILTIAVAISFFAGCGDSSEPENTEKPEANVEEKVSLDSGYWVLETMTMDGVEFSSDDIEGIYGELDTVMALAFSKEGKVSGVLFGDHFEATYTGTLEAFEIQISGDVTKGSYSEEKMILASEEGSEMVLINQEEMPESIASNPWITYEPEFSDEQTCAMSSFMMYGRYVVEDDVFYGLSHAASLNGTLAATPFYMKGDFPEFEESKTLDDRGAATYLNKVGDVLYYIMNGEEICRVGVDGSNREVIYKGACDYLQIHNDRIYFTDEKYHFVSVDMEGKDLVEVVNKEVYYPYFICSDWMIFQDDADSESLHLYNIAFGEEVNITYIPSYNPVMNGKYLYFIDGTGAEKGENYLCRIDMSDPEKFSCERSEKTLSIMDYMMDGSWVYASNDTSVTIDNWKNLSLEDTVLEEMEVYVSEGYKIYHYFDENGFIVGKYLMSKTKNGGTSFK